MLCCGRAAARRRKATGRRPLPELVQSDMLSDCMHTKSLGALCCRNQKLATDHVNSHVLEAVLSYGNAVVKDGVIELPS